MQWGTSAAYFSAATPTSGRNLWISDGTAADTRLVSDIDFNPDVSVIEIAVLGDIAFFSATSVAETDPSGRPVPILWRSDGTAAGTRRVLWGDGRPVHYASALSATDAFVRLVAMHPDDSQSVVIQLDASEGGVPFELPVDVPITTSSPGDPYYTPYATSETSLLVSRLGDVIAFSDTSTGGTWLGRWSGTSGVRAISDERFTFSGRPPGETSFGLWVTDGTAAGTLQVTNRSAAQHLSLSERADGRIIFVVGQPSEVRELWSFDPSNGHEQLEFELPRPGGQSGVDELAVGLEGGRIVFTANFQLWQTDGSQAGTIQLTDSADIYFLYPSPGVIPDGADFFYIAFDNTNPQNDGWFLYHVDTDQARVSQAGRLDQGIDFRLLRASDFAAGSGRLLFTGLYNGERELWGTDGTAPPSLLRDLNPANGHSTPTHFAADIDHLFFRYSSGFTGQLDRSGTFTDLFLPPFNEPDYIAIDQGSDFIVDRFSGIYVRPFQSSRWERLQTIASTASVAFPSVAAVVGESLYYWTATQGTRQLWVTNGTDSGTGPVRDPSGHVFSIPAGESDPDYLTVALDDLRLLIGGPDSSGGTSLWLAAGPSTATTEMIRLAEDETGDATQLIGAQFNRIVFRYGHRQLWSTDGTSGGTRQILEVNSGSLSLLAASESYAFYASRIGSEEFIWRTDGTVDGTVQIGSPGFYSERQAIAVDDQLFLTDRRELLTFTDESDLPLRLTELSLQDGPFGRPVSLFSAYGRLYFFADHPEEGWVLWSSDGTREGTSPLVDESGAIVPFPFREGDLSGFQGEIYYTGITEQSGVELIRINTDSVDDAPSLLRISRSNEPVLKWRGVAGAGMFDVEVIDPIHPLQTPLVFRVNQTNWTIPESLRQNPIQIRVRGVADNGSSGPWSSWMPAFTLSETPTLITIPNDSTETSPGIEWVSTANSIGTAVWVSDLELKQRVELTIVPPSNESIRLQPLSPSRYAFWMRSLTPAGPQEWTSVNTFTVLAAGPDQVALSADSSRHLIVNWSNVADATDYEIQVFATGVDVPVAEVKGIGTRTSWQFDTIFPGGRYEARVRSRRPGRVHSEWSSSGQILVREAPSVTADLPVIRWSKISAAVAYELEVTETGAGVTVFSGSLTSESYAFDPPPGPGRFRIRVRSVYSDASNSDWSIAEQELFHPPVNITTPFSETVDATPVIRWQPAADARTFDLEVYAAGSGTLVYRMPGISGSQHRISPPLDRGDYRVWIRSHHENGSRSRWGQGAVLRIGLAPALSASGRSLLWNAVEGATRYEVSFYIRDPSTGRLRPDHTRIVYGSPGCTVPSDVHGDYRIWVRAIRSEVGETYQSFWSAPVDIHLP